jgi:hypothetical protein
MKNQKLHNQSLITKGEFEKSYNFKIFYFLNSIKWDSQFYQNNSQNQLL